GSSRGRAIAAPRATARTRSESVRASPSGTTRIMPAREDGPMHRPPPDLLQRMPEQYFAGILGAVAAERARPGLPVIDLGRGNPDLPPPPHALAAAGAALADPALHGYAPFQGEPGLREAIAARYAADHGVAPDPDRQVAVVPGVKTAIMRLA